MKRRNVRPPLDGLFLFDIGEMEHVCDQVREDARGAALGEPATILKGLRNILIHHVERYISAHDVGSAHVLRIHVQAARALVETALDVCRQLEGGRGFDEMSADVLSRRLRSAWIEFIAMACASRMYVDQRKTVETAVANGARGGRPSEKAQRVRNVAARVIAGGSTAPHELAGKVALQVGCTPGYVRKVLSEPHKNRANPVG